MNPLTSSWIRESASLRVTTYAVKNAKENRVAYVEQLWKGQKNAKENRVVYVQLWKGKNAKENSVAYVEQLWKCS